MLAIWKFIIACLILHAIVVDGSANRARRRRRSHVLNEKVQSNDLNAKPEARSHPLPANSQMSNAQGKNYGVQGGRQYYGQNQFGAWSGMQGGQYYPNQGYGGNQYGYGQSNPGVYGNQFYGSSNYGGYNSGYGSGYNNYNNRPGYSNYNPSYGGYSGGYFWNSASKSTIGIFHIVLTSFAALYLTSIAM